MNCFSTLPTSLHLKSSYLTGVGYEVWSAEAIPSGTRFGPYERTEHQKEDLQWQVEEKEKTINNGCNQNNSSWLQFINCTCDKEQQNMIAIEHKSRIYYLTFKNIPANTEMLVGLFYQDELALDTNQKTGYRSCVQEGENIFEIYQNSRDKDTEDSNITKKRSKDIILQNDALYKNLLINTNLTKSSNLNELQTLFVTDRFYILFTKKENISIHNQQFGEEKSDKSKDNSKFDLSESRYIIENIYESSTNRNKLSKFSQLELHQMIHTQEILYNKDLEEKLRPGRSLKFIESQNLTNILKYSKNETNYSKKTQLNMHLENRTKKMYKNNISENSLQYGLNEGSDIGNRTFECNVCQKKFNKSKSLKMHQRIHADIKPHECNICKKKFYQKSHFKIHEMIHSDEKPYECHLCQKKFNQKSSLKVHERIHTDEKPYECHICQSKFNKSYDLKVHVRIHTGEKPYKCNVCQRKFYQNSHLKTHERIHTDEKLYECHVCQKKFNQKNNLKVHERLHSGTKPYECNLCQHKFNKSHDLKVHLRMHTGEKPFKCNICQNKFYKRNHLNTHKRIHTGEKPYECNICQTKFNNSYDLKVHKRIHTGEKPYECNVCEKKFNRKNSLKMHERIHTGEKPYQCSICEKKFYRSNHLKTHEWTHADEKP